MIGIGGAGFQTRTKPPGTGKRKVGISNLPFNGHHQQPLKWQGDQQPTVGPAAGAIVERAFYVENVYWGSHEVTRSDKKHVEMHKSPTHVILDIGCTKAMGSRPAIEAFMKAAWWYVVWHKVRDTPQSRNFQLRK
jgi:hypothetical protein